MGSAAGGAATGSAPGGAAAGPAGPGAASGAAGGLAGAGAGGLPGAGATGVAGAGGGGTGSALAVIGNANVIAPAPPRTAIARVIQRFLGRVEFRSTWSMSKKPTVLHP